LVNGIKYPRFLDVRDDEKSVLGDRWQIKEMVYQSGAMKGKPYTRYLHKGGKHKDVLSANKAVEHDCVETGRNVAEALAELKANREHRKKLEAEERKLEMKKAGIMKGQEREEALAWFQGNYGALTGAVVQAFPSWTTSWQFQPNCGQVAVTYIEPGGEKSWKLLKDLEASLGHRLRNGKEEEKQLLKETIQAGILNANQEIFANGSRSAKALGTEYVYTQPGCEKNEVMKKRKVEEEIELTVLKAGPAQLGNTKSSRPRRHSDPTPNAPTASEDDYVDHKGLTIRTLLLDKAAAVADLKEAGADGAEALASKAAELRTKLASRGFAEDHELLLICETSAFGGDAAKRPSVLSRLCGFYFRKESVIGDRSCYQQVLLTEGGVVCDGLYVWWDSARARWKVGSPVGLCKAGFAYRPGDAPSPAAAVGEGKDSACWRVLRGNFPGLSAPGGA